MRTLPILAIHLLAAVATLSTLANDPSPNAPETSRGWLEYGDGNRISGLLADLDNEKGFFESDRFGIIEFDLAEAHFIPESSFDTAPTIVPTSPAPFPAEAKTRAAWLPDLWYIDGSLSWKEGAINRESEIKLGFGANWKRERNSVELKLTSTYKHKNGEVDNNEQMGRLRWYRDTRNPSFFMVEGYLERDESDLFDIDFDYLLGKIGAGPGIRFDWYENSHSRVAVLYNFLGVELLEYDTSVSTEAYSIFFSNEFQLSGKLNLSQWGEYYFWRDGDEGLRNEIELTYRLTEHFSIGINHLHVDSSDTLKEKFNDEVKLFSRLTF